MLTTMTMEPTSCGPETQMSKTGGAQSSETWSTKMRSHDLNTQGRGANRTQVGENRIVTQAGTIHKMGDKASKQNG